MIQMCAIRKDTVFHFYSTIDIQVFNNVSASGGLPLPGLRLSSPLGDFRPRLRPQPKICSAAPGRATENMRACVRVDDVKAFCENVGVEVETVLERRAGNERLAVLRCTRSQS